MDLTEEAIVAEEANTPPRGSERLLDRGTGSRTSFVTVPKGVLASVEGSEDIGNGDRIRCHHCGMQVETLNTLPLLAAQLCLWDMVTARHVEVLRMDSLGDAAGLVQVELQTLVDGAAHAGSASWRLVGVDGATPIEQRRHGAARRKLITAGAVVQ